jgi:hypothetical protein
MLVLVLDNPELFHNKQDNCLKQRIYFGGRTPGMYHRELVLAISRLPQTKNNVKYYKLQFACII